MPWGVGHVGDATRAAATNEPHDCTSQSKESEEAATTMIGLQGPGKRFTEEHPEQSGSQVRGPANGEDGERLPRSELSL